MGVALPMMIAIPIARRPLFTARAPRLSFITTAHLSTIAQPPSIDPAPPHRATIAQLLIEADITEVVITRAADITKAVDTMAAGDIIPAATRGDMAADAITGGDTWNNAWGSMYFRTAKIMESSRPAALHFGWWCFLTRHAEVVALHFGRRMILNL